MGRQEIFLSAFLSSIICFDGVRSQFYKFELSKVTDFNEVNQQLQGSTIPCEICELDWHILEQICTDAAKACLHQYQFPLQDLRPYSRVLKVRLRTSRCVTGSFEEAVKCPTIPPIYLVDGYTPNEIRLMIVGFKKPERPRLDSLYNMKEISEYVDYLKQRFKHEIRMSGSSSAEGSSSRSGGSAFRRGGRGGGSSPFRPLDTMQRNKLKEHFRWFKEMKKRRKALKKGKKNKKHQQGGEEKEDFAESFAEELATEAAGAIPMPDFPEPDLSGIDLSNCFEGLGSIIAQFF